MARTRQPSGIAFVDPSYPYARNLRGAWLAGQSGLLQNASSLGGIGELTAVGSPSFVPTPYGIGVQLNGSSQYLTNTSNAAITQFPFTFFLLVNMSTAQANSARIMDISIGSGISAVAGLRYAYTIGFIAQHYDGGNSQTNAINPAQGTWHSLAGRFVSVSERSLFLDGALVSTNTDSRSTLSGIDRITIGFAPWGSEYLNGVVAAPLAFDTALPDAEILALHQNPWRWAKAQRRLWIQIGAAAGGPTTWTYTPTGGLTVAGTAPVLRGKVHIPSGGIALAGAATTTASQHAYVYAPSGGLTIAGTAPVLKGKIYTPSGGIALAGTAPLLKGKVYVVAGGVTLAGAAATSYSAVGSTSYPYLPTGGITLAGAATTTATRFYVAPVSGGIVLAGTAASSFTSTAAQDYEFLPTGGLTFGGTAAIEGPGGELGGRPIFPRRRKRYLIKDRVYNDLDPADVIAAAKEAGVDLGDVREVVKEPAQRKAAPRRADDEGREYWLPQEFWGRAAARQKVEATSPLGEDFQRAIEAIRASAGPLRARLALRQRQEEEAILLLMA